MFKPVCSLLLLVAYLVASASAKPSFTFQLKDRSPTLKDLSKVDLQQHSGSTRKVWDIPDDAEQTKLNTEEDAGNVSRLVASRRDKAQHLPSSSASNDSEKSILSILEEIRETKRELQEEMEALRAEASDLMAV